MFTRDAFVGWLQEKKLMGARCGKCGQVYLPPRPYCPSCRSSEMEWHELSGRGEVAAFTAVHVAPTFMEKQGFGRGKPYATAVVRLQEGPGISARLVGVDAARPEEIKVGTQVEVDFLEVEAEGGKQVDLAFRPAT
ncbi:MAG: Zn-ribbon domain-containing OB-fold protein [Clostridia bacterium]|nr:MAG: Zn-ribbon domain-containing OB-fold protein [Clostridia bacterium]